MTVYRHFIRIVFLWIGFFGCSIFLSAGQINGLVTAVYDGDTIRVRKDNGLSETVRLIGIDTPELNDSREIVRLQALLAKRFTYVNLYHCSVQLVLEPQQRDKYGRLLAFVFIGNISFNEKIIRKGFASVYLKFPFRNDFRRRFERAYREARDKEVGLWRPEPYPKILLSDLSVAQGTLGRVDFICREVEEKRGLVLLHSQSRKFAALIFRKDLAEFQNVKRFINREICVFGLIESFREQPQVVLFLPRQIIAN